MHELAITESVVATVSEHMGSARITAVTLEIGRLSGVVADSVRFCFDLCTQGTSLEGARLEIVDVLGRGYCRLCRADVEIEDSLPLCPCGSADLEILGGQQLKITQVQVEVT
ncbi:MAG: hydrogenase maturation nickel metallochaperone HypA [Egibacteraceae bacterium]